MFTTAGHFLTACIQDGGSELIPRRVEINGNQESLARSSVVITQAIGSDSTGMWLISPWLYHHSIREACDEHTLTQILNTTSSI